MSFLFYHVIYEIIFLINIIVGVFLANLFADFNLKYMQNNGWFSELAFESKSCKVFY